MTALLDKVADLAIAPLTNTPLLSTATTFELLSLPGDIYRFPDPLKQGYYAWVWNRSASTGFPNVGDADRNGQAERVRVIARDVGLGTLTVVRGASPINLNVAGGEYWLVGAMNAQIIEDIDDRLWDISGGVLTTTKNVTAPKLTLTSELDMVAAAGVAPINLFEDPGNGTSKVQITAPPALSGDIPIQLLGTLPGGVEFLTISPTGVMGTSPATTAISLDDAYNEGRIIIADVGAVEIQGNGLQLTDTQPALLFETTNAGPSTFNWRFIASSVDSFHLQRGDQDEDIDDDAFVNAFRYDGDTRRLGLNGAAAPSDLLHLFNPITGPTRIRLQPLDNLDVSDVGILIVNSGGVSLWEFGHDISSNAFIFGRLTFANPALGILNSDGRVSVGKAPGVGIGDTAARLDVFNPTASLAAGYFRQAANFPAVVIKSDATNSPLLALQPLSTTNVRGDIFFGLRTSGASTPFAGDMWYDNTNDRLEFRHGSSLTRAITTRFGPDYGPTQQVSIVGVNITVATGGHYQVSGAAFPAADVLEGIIITGAGPKDGDTIMLRMATGSGQITVSTVAGNIRLNGNSNIALNVINDTLVLMFIAATSQWVQVSHSNNAI